jgi:hypothetical protein
VACYDPKTGEPVIRTIGEGQELEAARCSMGCLGIITSLRLPIRKQYQVEEHFCGYARLEDVLAQEETYPIQQFFFLPWRWDFLAQHRREVDRPVSPFIGVYRIYWSVGMDFGLHVMVKLASTAPSWLVRFFFRILSVLARPNWHFTDLSHRQLTMQHELFRHLEMELFVRRSLLKDSLACVQEIVERFSAAGIYTHHYPICIRKVLPDATLISMSSGWGEPVYAVSFITYVKPDRRKGFFAMAQELATTLATRFDARPHWGKYCPLPPEELVRLYPRLRDFAAIANAADPAKVFRNEWMQSIFDVIARQQSI